MGGGLRRGSDRILAGVCSGIGDYLRLDPSLVRVVFVILALAPPGVGIIIYLVLWFLMEPAGGSQASSANAGHRVRQMGDELRRQFRGGWWQAESGPSPSPGASDPAATSRSPSAGGRLGGPTHGGRPTGLWVGIVLVALGAYFLLANLGYLSGFRWDLFWPVILIAIGLLVLFRRRPR